MKSLLDTVLTMANSRVSHYVIPGLTSHLIGGNGHGKVRLLSADRDSREWVTPHSHRFDFTCLVLAGTVENIVFERAIPRQPGANTYARGILKPIQEGLGRYDFVRTHEWSEYVEIPSIYTEGETYSMTADQIHSIKFARGTHVLFFEGPNVTEESVVLEPWSNGKTVPTFETRSWMFERESDGT